MNSLYETVQKLNKLYGISLIQPKDLDLNELKNMVDNLNKSTDLFKYTTIDEYVKQAMNGSMLIFRSYKVLALVSIKDFPTGLRQANIDLALHRSGASGDTPVDSATIDTPYSKEEAQRHMKYLEFIAKVMKCDRIKIEGRAGWAKIHPSFNKQTTLIKELDSGSFTTIKELDNE